jgi:hypothetical protein
MGGRHGTVEERLLRRIVASEDGCLLWAGPVNKDGYGSIWDPSLGYNDKVHRAAWKIQFGEIPEGHHLDHYLCGNTRCVNTDHLRLETPSEHGKLTMEKRWGKGRTHCGKGHPYVQKGGRNYCRECARESERRYEARTRRRHAQ